MNEPQRLYLVQARSDWEVYKLLSQIKGLPICHELHYLQMCVEKLAKAYLWKNRGAAHLGHAALTKFIRAIAQNRDVAEGIGFSSRIAFGEWIKDISDLAYELERLAPALAGGGPNPEYPWPRENPRYAPVEHEFTVWESLRTRSGECLWRMLDQLLRNFEAWF